MTDGPFSRLGTPPALRRSLIASCACLALGAPAFAQTVAEPPAPAASTPTPAPVASSPSPAASAPTTKASAPAATPAAPAARPVAPTRGATQLDTVEVTGQRAALRDAMQAQQAADNIVSIVRSDGIGKLPDTNAAEALQRIPGISVQRDQGEGRYITVRGLGADLNATTINGAGVPSPEASSRGVALDVLPAGLIRSLEVSKTLTPDRDANSLGGSVEIKTLSAFDLPGTFMSVDVGGSRDGNTGQYGRKLGSLWADRFAEGKFGVALGLSHEKRKFGSDNVETGGSWDGDALEGFELRDYLPQRQRDALALTLDYRPSNEQKYYLRGLSSRYSDSESRDRLTVGDFEDDTVVEGQLAEAELERRLRQRKFTQTIQSVVIGTEQKFGDWGLDASGGTSRAREKTPESIADARFVGSDPFAGVGFTNTRSPRLIAPDAAFDAASYELDDLRLSARDSQDRERHLKFDITRSFELGEREFDLKFGGKTSRRSTRSDEEVWSYDDDDPTSGNYWGPGSTSLTAFAGGPVDYALGRFGPSISPALVRARVAGLPRAGARDGIDSTVADFSINEDIDAAYVMGSTTVGKFWFMGGVRVERTKLRARGTRVNEEDETFDPVLAERSYTDVLPGLHARYNLGKQTSVRAAWTNAVVRPNFEQLSPGFVQSSATEAEFGNPNLEPLTASNFDLGIEHALGRDGAMSAYLFTKNIKNFVYQTNLAGTGDYVGFDDAITFVNGERAKVRGLELAYQQALRMLPEPFNGLILGANATFTRSKARIAQFDADSGTTFSRNISLPGQSDRVFNASLAYEAGPISTRIAVNSKSPYILEIGDVLDAGRDAIVDKQTQIDFSFQYKLSAKLQLSFEIQNVNDEKFYAYQGSRPYNFQYEQYGRTYKLGLRALLF